MPLCEAFGRKSCAVLFSDKLFEPAFLYIAANLFRRAVKTEDEHIIVNRLFAWN